MKSKPQVGRPRQGSVANDGQDRIRDYPKLAVTIRPDTRAKLNAAAAVEQRSAWKIVDDAINDYVRRMPAEERKMTEAIAAKSKAIGVWRGYRTPKLE